MRVFIKLIDLEEQVLLAQFVVADGPLEVLVEDGTSRLSFDGRLTLLGVDGRVQVELYERVVRLICLLHHR